MLYKTFPFKVEVKADQPDDSPEGHFSGYASVYGNVDSYGDVVMPGAFNQTLQQNAGSIVILSQHNPDKSIGLAQLKDTDQALTIEDGVLELGLQDAKDAYLRLKKKLVTGISIGYEVNSGGYAYTKDGVRQLTSLNLWEVSLVTFPANTLARVTGVKSAEMEISRLYAELKAGRMLSAANLRMVQDAHDAGKAMCEKLKSLIDAASAIDEDDKSQTERDEKALLLTEGLTALLGEMKTFTKR